MEQARTVWGLVEQAARDRPHDLVLADDHARSLTLSAFRSAGERVAAGLHERGLRPGHVVSWQLPTTLESAVLMVACARLGVIQNPIIPILREREVAAITSQVHTQLFIVPEVWRGFRHGGLARSLGVPDVLALDWEAPPAGELRLPAGDAATLPPSPASAHECRWLYYSSGTTAEPKGARHTDATLIASSNGMVGQLGIGAGDVYPIAWPITHIGGIAMLSSVLRAGGTLVLFDTFDPVQTPLRMAAHNPTILGSAAPFFRAYLAAQRDHGAEPLFPSLRICTGGGAAIPVEVNREIIEVLGVPGVAISWGLTEFPVATGESPGDGDLGTTVGRPADGVQVRAVDGELRLKGPQCFLGYIDPALDAAAFDEEGWFRTGDLGVVDETGRTSVDGRLKDVIIRNAENVSALEVEDVLAQHPAISDVAVVGIPDPRTGERVCAVVVLGPADSTAAELSLADLVEHCRTMGLARQKIPEQLMVVDALPRTPMGKILKTDLRGWLTEPKNI